MNVILSPPGAHLGPEAIKLGSEYSLLTLSPSASATKIAPSEPFARPIQNA